MGHTLGDSGTYLRYYMPNFIGADVQSIIFGSSPQTDLMQLMGRLHRHQHAPKALTDQQKLEVAQDKTLTRYIEKRKRALERIKRAGYASASAAKDTPEGKVYDKYRKKVESVRNVLLRKRMEQAVQEFHKTIHSKEVNQQLQGIKPTEVAQSDMKYELPERALVASLFSQVAEVQSREELHQLRMKLVMAIASLCKRRESPCRRPSRQGRKSCSKMQEVSDRVESGPSPQLDTRSCPSTIPRSVPTSYPSKALITCPFCKSDTGVGHQQRGKTWRLDSLARHIRGQHLNRLHTPFPCPYDDCDAVLETPDHFVKHTGGEHNVRLPSSVLPDR